MIHLMNPYKTLVGGALVGFVFALLAGVIVYLVMEWRERQRPIEARFRTEVVVPDFVRGTDPPIVYRLRVTERFVGDFSVSIRDLGRKPGARVSACRGEGRNIPYEPTITDDGEWRVIDDETLGWYLGQIVEGPADCVRTLPPGFYRPVTTYTLRQDGRAARTYVSDDAPPFRVFEAGTSN